jgi:hypothetical protein
LEVDANGGDVPERLRLSRELSHSTKADGIPLTIDASYWSLLLSDAANGSNVDGRRFALPDGICRA